MKKSDKIELRRYEKELGDILWVTSFFVTLVSYLIATIFIAFIGYSEAISKNIRETIITVTVLIGGIGFGFISMRH